MKKIVALVMAVLFCAQTALPALALIPKHTNIVNSNIYTANINNSTEDQAAMLKELGLFIGSDKGFELERHLTRAEAGILLVRVLGMENEALAQTNAHPFKDVPSWADKQVGWLYQNKITAGVNATAYGSAQPVTYWQFATFLSRACSGQDDFRESGVGWRFEQEQCDGKDGTIGNGFYRADAVGMLTRFLTLTYTASADSQLHSMPPTVAQHLVQTGVFSAETLAAAGVDVYPIDYYGEGGVMTATILDVPIRTSAYQGITANTSRPRTELPYFYTLRVGLDESILYRMDCLSLAETELARFDVAISSLQGSISYYGTTNGQDSLGLYIGVSHASSVYVAVYVDGDNAEVMSEYTESSSAPPPHDPPVTVKDNTLQVTTQDDRKNYPLAAGTRLVTHQDNVAVLYRMESGKIVVEGMDITNGRIVDRYYAKPSQVLSPLSLRPSDFEQFQGIYGAAGLFVVRGGRLLRITDRPVINFVNAQRGTMTVPVIVTSNADSADGDTLVAFIEDGKGGWTEEILLGNDPPHGIAFSGIGASDDTLVFFVVEHPGNFRAIYAPVYNEAEGHMGIWVKEYAYWDSETMTEDADERYMQQEQERLNALGYNPGEGGL